MNAILERTSRCAGGVEARRFNRLLIEAGLIKGPLRTVPPWYWPWPTRDADRPAARARSQYWSINSLPHLIYTTWSIIRELHSRAVEASINVR